MSKSANNSRRTEAIDAALGAAVTGHENLTSNATGKAAREAIYRQIPAGRALPGPDDKSAVQTHAAWGDVVRIVGTIAVIASHITAELIQGGYKKFVGQAHVLSQAEFWTANAVDSVARFAVPVFVMLSGALLLKARPIDAGRFYKRRLSRVLVPAIFFTALYGALVLRSPVGGVDVLLKNLAQGAPVAHLHFIFRILGLYAFTPMICIFLAGADRRMVWITTLMIFSLGAIHGAIIPALGYHATAVGMFVPFLGYYLAGYLLRDTVVSWKGTLLASLGLLLGWAGVAYGTGWMWHHYGTVHPSIPTTLIFYDFLNPCRIVMSISAFVLIRRFFDKPWPDSPFWKFVSHRLAPATLGIYLLHPFIQGVLDKLNLHSYTLPVGVGIPVLTALVLVVSAAIVIGLMHVPYVNWIVGERVGRKKG